MKKILVVLVVIFGLAFVACDNGTTSGGETDPWRNLTGPSGVSFWAVGAGGNLPGVQMLAFYTTPSGTRYLQIWNNRNDDYSMVIFDITDETMTRHSSDNRKEVTIVTQGYHISRHGNQRGLDLEPVIHGLIYGGTWFEIEAPEWWRPRGENGQPYDHAW